MNPSDDDRDLTRAFALLRETDRREAPDLERLLARSASVPPVRGLLWRTLPYALLVAALVGVLVYRMPAWRGPEAPPEVGSLADWRSPTEALLVTPGRELMAELPELGGSLTP